MGTVRDVFKATVIRTGLMAAHYRRTRDRVRILMYHGVSERSVPVAEFEQQLLFLKKHFDFAWVRELPQLLSSMPLERPTAVLTFDDGRSNNARTVAPLLARHGIKATFFLLPGLMNDEQRLMWNHELTCRLLLLPGDQLADFLGGPVGDPEVAVERFVASLKERPHRDSLEVLDRARRLTAGVELEDWMKDEYQLMSRSEAEALPDLIEVGSHSVNHPILTRLSPQRAEEEIVGSRRLLEEQLGIEVRTFCYPNGDSNAEVVDIVRRHYDAAVSTEHGTTQAGDDVYQLRRIAAPFDAKNLASALR